MSKSAGNFFTLRQLLDKGYIGREIRYVLLSAHYRKKLNFTFDSLDSARAMLKRFNALFDRLRAADGPGDDSVEEISDKAKSDFATALADDLNVSEAAAVIFGLQKDANRLLDTGSLSNDDAGKILDCFRYFDQVYAVFEVDEADGEEVPTEVVDLAERRKIARADKNWAEADAIRDQLKELGYVVEDAADGFRITKI